MPRILTLTQKPDESPEQFAARLAGQVSTFFGEEAGATDVSAAPEKEPAPSA